VPPSPRFVCWELGPQWHEVEVVLRGGT
jgi:hypothetical protein